jgi:hypothetical protein
MTPETAVVRDDDELLLAQLKEARRLIAAHPRLTRAIVSTLVEEGRAFAATPEGALLKARMQRSEAVPRARLLWDALDLGAHAGRAPAFGPRRWLGLFAAAAGNPALEELLSRMSIPGDGR